MTSQDFQPVFEAAFLAIAAVVTAMMKIYIPRAISAYEKWVGVKLTDQERAAISDAADTAAGIIKTRLDQGVLKVSDVAPENPQIKEIARTALSRVPAAALSQDVTTDAMAHIVVGKADTSATTPSGGEVPPKAARGATARSQPGDQDDV